jgi:hypothetical protein
MPIDIDKINRRVDQALAKNRRSESIQIAMACCLFVLGVLIVGVGYELRNPYIAAGSGLLQLLLLFPIREIGKLRQDNLILQTFPILASLLPERELAQAIVALLRHLLESGRRGVRDSWLQ